MPFPLHPELEYLRSCAKGHQAIWDVFCGVENVDWENPFPEEYDVDAASAYMSGFDDKIETMKKERRSFFGENILKLCEMADIVFLGLHGSNGEDGRLQATFDLMGIQYTGTGYLAVQWLWIRESPSRCF